MKTLLNIVAGPIEKLQHVVRTAQDLYTPLYAKGAAKQIQQFCEETAELTIAISHRERGKTTDNENLAEELADCLLMFDQMMHHFGVSQEDLDVALLAKLSAFNNRMSKHLAVSSSDKDVA